MGGVCVRNVEKDFGRWNDMTDNYCPKCRHMLGEPRGEDYKICYNCNITFQIKLCKPYMQTLQSQIGDFK